MNAITTQVFKRQEDIYLWSDHLEIRTCNNSAHSLTELHESLVLMNFQISYLTYIAAWMILAS